MTTVAKSVSNALSSNPSTLSVHVKVRSSDQVCSSEQAVAAIDTAVADYLQHIERHAQGAGISWEPWMKPRFTSKPVPVSGGAVFWADMHDMPAALSMKLVELIAGELDNLGPDSSQVVTPAPHAWEDGGYDLPAVALWALVPPWTGHRDDPNFRERFAPAWFDVATRWVETDTAALSDVWCSVDNMTLPVSLEDFPHLVESVAPSVDNAFFATGENSDHIRAASTYRGIGQLYLAAGHSATTAELPGTGALLDDARRLIEITRTLAPEAAYVLVDFLPKVELFGWSHALTGGKPNALVNTDLAWVSDEFILQAAPFQIIGEKHMAKLPNLAGPDRAVESLGKGKFAVTAGNLDDWLLTSSARDSCSSSWNEKLAAAIGTPEQMRTRKGEILQSHRS